MEAIVTIENVPYARYGLVEKMAMHRFFDNASVVLDAILIAASSGQSMIRQAVVSCLQDMVKLDFSGQQVRGLGPLSYEVKRAGMSIPPTWYRRRGGHLGMDACIWMRELRDASC